MCWLRALVSGPPFSPHCCAPCLSVASSPDRAVFVVIGSSFAIAGGVFIHLHHFGWFVFARSRPSVIPFWGEGRWRRRWGVARGEENHVLWSFVLPGAWNMRIFVVVISLSTKDNLRPRSAGGVLKYFGTLLLWFVSVSLLFFFCLTDLTACVCVTRGIPLVVPVQWCRTIFIFRVLERSNFRSNTQAGPKWVRAGLLQHTHAVRAASFSIFKSLQHFSGPPIGGVCAECWKDCFTLRPACTRASALLGPWQARCHSLASISNQ